jgi:hypothetical protein
MEKKNAIRFFLEGYVYDIYAAVITMAEMDSVFYVTTDFIATRRRQTNVTSCGLHSATVNHSMCTSSKFVRVLTQARDFRKLKP